MLASDIVSWMKAYRQADLFSSTETICIKRSKKGKFFVGKAQIENASASPSSSNSIAPSLEHNRQKQYLIPEGEPIAPLYDLGVFTQDGHVAAGKYDKYKQINRFV